jgi:hypothetical protein
MDPLVALVGGQFGQNHLITKKFQVLPFVILAVSKWYLYKITCRFPLFPFSLRPFHFVTSRTVTYQKNGSIIIGYDITFE